MKEIKPKGQTIDLYLWHTYSITLSRELELNPDIHNKHVYICNGNSHNHCEEPRIEEVEEGDIISSRGTEASCHNICTSSK